MNISQRSRLGRSAVSVTGLGLGTAPLGHLYQPVSDNIAVDTILRAYSLGIRWFDTAPLYGQGLAEKRLGMALQLMPRGDVVVATKVGYVLPESKKIIPQSQWKHNYTYDGVLRSVEESLQRLGCDTIDILQIHDPDDYFDVAIRGAYRALKQLQNEGVVKAIGVGMNQSALLVEFAKSEVFDSFLLAGRYTLLDQSAAEDLLPIALIKAISVLSAAPFNSGILANPWADNPMFNYKEASLAWIEQARRLDSWCQAEAIPLKAAALQFPLLHPAVAGVLVGARTPDEIEENVRMAQFPIPGGFWERAIVAGLVHEPRT